MCLNLGLAQPRRDTKGSEGQAARAKTALQREGLASAPTLLGTWAAGSAKTAVILKAEEKNTNIQDRTRDIIQVIAMNLNGRGEKCHVFSFQSKPHKFNPLNTGQAEVTDPLPSNSRRVRLDPTAGGHAQAAGEAAALGGCLLIPSHGGDPAMVTPREGPVARLNQTKCLGWTNRAPSPLRGELLLPAAFTSLQLRDYCCVIIPPHLCRI